jgi:hypothetical protein
MLVYTPDPAFSRAAQNAMLSQLPLFGRLAIKVIPSSARERVINEALARVLPLSLRTMAAAHEAGTRLALTTHSELTETAKSNIIKRIARWLVPNEVKELNAELNKETVRLGRAEFEEDGSWKVEEQNNEIVLIVLRSPPLKETADTVFDAFFDSFDSLQGLKDKVLQKLNNRM